jgi:hypothetical protein
MHNSGLEKVPIKFSEGCVVFAGWTQQLSSCCLRAASTAHYSNLNGLLSGIYCSHTNRGSEIYRGNERDLW